LVVLSFEVNPLWIRESVGIAICGTVDENDWRPLADGGAGNLNVGMRGTAGPELHRGLETQELLDARNDQLRSTPQLVERIRIAHLIKMLWAIRLSVVS
jgi:hypothetical protein